MTNTEYDIVDFENKEFISLVLLMITFPKRPKISRLRIPRWKDDEYF